MTDGAQDRPNSAASDDDSLGAHMFDKRRATGGMASLMGAMATRPDSQSTYVPSRPITPFEGLDVDHTLPGRVPPALPLREVVRPRSASMFSSALFSSRAMPVQKGVRQTETLLEKDQLRPGMSRFQVKFPQSGQNKKYCRPKQGEEGWTPPKLRYPAGIAFRTDTLKRFFLFIDRDNSGKITRLELLNALREQPMLLRMFSESAQRQNMQTGACHSEGKAGCGGTWKDEVYFIRQVLNQVDLDKSGSMEWPEFLHFFKRADLHFPSPNDEENDLIPPSLELLEGEKRVGSAGAAAASWLF